MNWPIQRRDGRLKDPGGPFLRPKEIGPVTGAVVEVYPETLACK